MKINETQDLRGSRIKFIYQRVVAEYFIQMQQEDYKVFLSSIPHKCVVLFFFSSFLHATNTTTHRGVQSGIRVGFGLIGSSTRC